MSRTSGRSDSPRVAVVYPMTFGDDGIYGGGERYAVELARALSRRVPARLVSFAERPRVEVVDGLEIHLHKPSRYLHGNRLNPLSFGFLSSLADVDVVHCASWNVLVTDLAVLAARLRRQRDFVTDVGGGGAFTLHRYLQIANWVDRFLLIAPQGGAQFLDHRDRWSILFAGIDTERFRPLSNEARRGVLFVGRLLPHKGVNYLIEAMDPAVPLTVVGRPYDQEYFDLLSRLAEGKNVTFRTEATDDEVLRLYQTSEVSVLPSVCRTIYGKEFALPELLGFAAMEAMSCATPVLITRVGALTELFADGECGFHVPPNDPKALRTKLDLLLGEPDLAARLGARARERILEIFTWDHVADRCLAAYALA